VRNPSITFDRLLNVLTACLLVAVVAGLIRQETKAVPSNSKAIPKAGTQVSLDGVDWSKNQETVLMVVASDCGFCENSAEFHRSVAAYERPGIHVMAVFKRSDTLETARAYLAKHGIKVSDIRIAALSSVKAGGTPTIEIVDNTGSVVRSWMGQLDDTGQQEVASALERDDPWFRREVHAVERFLGN
jgi:hypothetical protein